MFHVELRQFPHLARAFNLTREELQDRILVPWLTYGSVELSERRWSAEKARLTVYEGPRLDPADLGQGRGWSNAARGGRDVTDELLGAAVTPQQDAADWLKQQIARSAGERPLALADVLAMMNERHPDWRVSDRLAIAESAVWELLHRGAVRMTQAGAPVESSRWEQVVLDWGEWSGDSSPDARLERPSGTG